MEDWPEPAAKKTTMRQTLGQMLASLGFNVSASVVVSMAAFAISSATFYQNFLVVERKLSISLGDVAEDGMTIRLVAVAVNSGNRDVAIVEAGLSCRYSGRNVNSEGFGGLESGPKVVNGGEIDLLRISAAIDKQAVFRRCEVKTGDLEGLYPYSSIVIAMRVSTIVDTGERFEVVVPAFRLIKNHEGNPGGSIGIETRPLTFGALVNSEEWTWN